jgi:hypothetical protein
MWDWQTIVWSRCFPLSESSSSLLYSQNLAIMTCTESPEPILTYFLLTYLLVFCLLTTCLLTSCLLAYFLLACLLTYLLTCCLLTYLLLTCLFACLLLACLLTPYLHTYLLTYVLTYLITYLVTYLLTSFLLTSRSRSLLETITGFQLVNKFPSLYGSRIFITAFTSAHHLSLS